MAKPPDRGSFRGGPYTWDREADGSKLIRINTSDLACPDKRFLAHCARVAMQDGSVVLFFGQRILQRTIGIVGIQLEPDNFTRFAETLSKEFRDTCAQLLRNYRGPEDQSMQLSDEDLKETPRDRCLIYPATLGTIYVGQGANLEWYQIHNRAFREMDRGDTRLSPPEPIIQISSSIPVLMRLMDDVDATVAKLK